MINIYLRDISAFSQLTPEQQTQLIHQLEQGDPSARQRLIESHLRMVVPIARRYMRPGVELCDLIQEGNIGLIEAVDRYDPALGRFSCYARYWVKKMILLYLGQEDDGLLSLDKEYSDEDGECVTWGDTISDEATELTDQSFECIEDQLIREERRVRVYELLERLQCREREVVMMLYGFGFKRAMSRQEVAYFLGMSQERVSHLHTQAVRRLNG